MTRLLLTNDDGVDAPPLVPFARALGALDGVAAVDVVVPDRERSWVGKAISRTEEVVLARTHRDGLPVTTCTGYPADAAQLGIHAVGGRPPDLVVSGINLGYNHGAAFLLSSGTVGAALEGWISGVRAIAFSTGVMTGYDAWRRHAGSPDAADDWRRLADTCAQLVADVWAAGLLDAADTVSVNLPFDATPTTARRVTTIARTRYDRLFERVGPDRYRHAFRGVPPVARLDGTDVEAANDGVVSITALRAPAAVDVPSGLRATVERPGGTSAAD